MGPRDWFRPLSFLAGSRRRGRTAQPRLEVLEDRTCPVLLEVVGGAVAGEAVVIDVTEEASTTSLDAFIEREAVKEVRDGDGVLLGTGYANFLLDTRQSSNPNVESLTQINLQGYLAAGINSGIEGDLPPGLIATVTTGSVPDPLDLRIVAETPEEANARVEIGVTALFSGVDDPETTDEASATWTYTTTVLVEGESTSVLQGSSEAFQGMKEENGEATIQARVGDTFTATLSLEGVGNLFSGAGSGGEGSAPSTNGGLFVAFRTTVLPGPDIAVTQLQAPAVPNGDVVLGYGVLEEIVDSPPPLSLYWASGPTLEDRIGEPVFSTPVNPEMGAYTEMVSRDTLGAAPLGATYLLLVADLDDDLEETNEDNNVQALALPNLAGKEIAWNDDDGELTFTDTSLRQRIDFEYLTANTSPPPGSEAQFFWASGETVEDILGAAADPFLMGGDADMTVEDKDPARWGAPPPGTTHILLVFDPQDRILEFIETDNVLSLELHSVEELLDGALTTQVMGATMTAAFAPGGGQYTLSEAEVRFGVDHFNWLQWVQPPENWEIRTLVDLDYDRARASGLMVTSNGLIAYRDNGEVVFQRAITASTILDPIATGVPADFDKYTRAFVVTLADGSQRELVAYNDPAIPGKGPLPDPYWYFLREEESRHWEGVNNPLNVDAKTLRFKDAPAALDFAFTNSQQRPYLAFGTQLVGVLSDRSQFITLSGMELPIGFFWKSDAIVSGSGGAFDAFLFGAGSPDRLEGIDVEGGVFDVQLVTDLPPLSAVSIAPIPDQILPLGTPLTLTAQGSHQSESVSVVYTLDPGAPPGAAIDAQTGVLTLAPRTEAGERSLTVRVTDPDDPDATAAATFTVTVARNAPTDLALDGTILAENQPAGTLVGNLSVTDPDRGETYTFTLVAGAGSEDNASFVIDGDGLRTAASFDFEDQSTFTIRVRATDPGGLFTEEAFTVTVTDVEEAPPAYPAQPVGNGLVSFAPDTALWYVRGQSDTGPTDEAPFAYGAPGWIPVTGDWDGDGLPTIGVLQPTGATQPGSLIWYLRNANTAGAPDVDPFAYGYFTWTPVAGDWDGDGTTTVGVVDRSGDQDPTGVGARWLLRNTNSAGAPDTEFFYGAASWVPVVGDWDGDGTDTPGAFDPATGTWYLRNTNSAGAPDVVFSYGYPGWTPVVGDWDGDGTDTVGVVDGDGVWYLGNRNDGGAPEAGTFPYGLGGWVPLAGAAHVLRVTEGATAREADRLTPGQLDEAFDATLERLRAAGVDAEVVNRFAQVTPFLVDLPGAILSMSNRDGRIFLDASGAGYGYFVDPSPQEDGEFSAGTAVAPEATGKVDLLTVLARELAGRSGAADLFPDALPTGTRRLDGLGEGFGL